MLLFNIMTAEIVIMNKESIAIASDSAVTMVSESNHKIFTSANKLFSLSYKNPIGIMIYQNASFMGMPWETIIKVYRDKFSDIKCHTLEEYADKFIQFLEDNRELFPESLQKNTILFNIESYFRHIREDISKKVGEKIEKHDGAIDTSEINTIVSNVIDLHYNIWINTENIPSIPNDFNENIIIKYKDQIDEIIKQVFQKLPISDDDLDHLFVIASSIFSKYPEQVNNGNYSGIVIAGFGDKEYYPSFKSYEVEFVACNKIKYKVDKHVYIDEQTTASVSPFAQREMVDMFMRGIDPSIMESGVDYLRTSMNHYTDLILSNIQIHNDEERKKFEKTFNDSTNDIVEEYINNMHEYQITKHINPVVNVVTMLPKDELALMAESLVNLTSFKRKLTVGAETVAGPIDVAVISKGDGFIWIKRKHYFQPELNPSFINKYMER